jgi:hypothetical protein
MSVQGLDVESAPAGGASGAPLFGGSEPGGAHHQHPLLRRAAVPSEHLPREDRLPRSIQEGGPCGLQLLPRQAAGPPPFPIFQPMSPLLQFVLVKTTKLTGMTIVALPEA